MIISWFEIAVRLFFALVGATTISMGGVLFHDAFDIKGTLGKIPFILAGSVMALIGIITFLLGIITLE